MMKPSFPGQAVNHTHIRLAVAYYRVSTDRQGQSGLGLDAQKEAVSRYALAQGLTINTEYTEVESGRKKKRPQLATALQQAKREKAILLIAKLDRLARNVHFISGLIESGVEFKAVDNPHATKAMLQMMAVFAELESDQIRTRVREALAQAKARGTILGRNGKVLAEVQKREAAVYAAELAPALAELEAKGFTSIRAKVAELNRQGTPSRLGGRWHIRTLHLLEKRIHQDIQ